MKKAHMVAVRMKCTIDLLHHVRISLHTDKGNFALINAPLMLTKWQRISQGMHTAQQQSVLL